VRLRQRNCVRKGCDLDHQTEGKGLECIAKDRWYAHTATISMAIMTIRTTVAFDPATAQRLERLAKLWGISKSETLRRALEAAEKNLSDDPRSNFSKMTPKEALEWLHTNPVHPPGTGDQWSKEIRRQRITDASAEQKRQRRSQGNR
jgi:Ribbon-helix-helix protein, copG family